LTVFIIIKVKALIWGLLAEYLGSFPSCITIVLPMSVTQRFVQKRYLNLFNVFSQSIKRQVAENKELQENVKYLTDESTRLNQTEAMQRAKDAMKSTSKVVQTVGKAASVIGDATFTVVDKTAETMEKVAKPVLETRAGKAISQNVRKIQREISSSSVSARYVEYKPKEERERELEEREREAFAANPLEYKRLRAPVTPNETATAVELHQSSVWEQKWSKFKENNPLMQSVTRVQKNMEESDHPFMERFREWYHNFSKESEHAQVINAIKMVEPGFHIDRFVKDAAEFYIPDIMEAYLQGNMAVLSEWCSEQVYLNHQLMG
jgi:import inner membrane translocase subunit TIM44